MNTNFSRRALIRMGSYLTALVVVLGAGAIVGYSRANNYKRQLEYTYMRSLQELSSYVTNISNTLDKGTYAGTPAQLSTLSAKLWREAGSAKAALSSLPLTELELQNTYKFLSQVGDYTMDLSKKAGADQTVNQDDQQNLQSLLAYSRTLNQQISSIQQKIDRGDLSLDGIVEEAHKSRNGADSQQSPDSTAESTQLEDFTAMEDSFEGYPKLIYDGPFSDHMLTRQPLLLEGQPNISQTQAQQKVATATGISNEALTYSGMEESLMASYCFAGEEITAAVTIKGGYLAYLTNARAIGDRTLTNEEAIQRAEEYLERLGVHSLATSYYEVANGTCTVNFAHTQNDITCYTDLIKVGVALDDGEIVFMDARGYITNHHERTLPAPAIDEDTALASVSKALQPERAGLALIPSSGANEVLCYEFHCKGKDDQNVLVYVNAATGAEEQILLLIETDEGVLTV